MKSNPFFYSLPREPRPMRVLPDIGYVYVYRGRQSAPERYGQRCKLLMRDPVQAVVEFEDGQRVRVAGGTVRRAG